MKTLLQPSSSLFVSAALFLAGCNIDMGERGNGDLIDQTRETGTFQEIELQGNFEVILQKSADNGVVITTDENLMDYIEVDNAGGHLTIRSTRRIRPSNNSRIIIKYQELDHVEVSGAASLRSDDIISGNEMHISMSGAGEVDLDLDIGRLELDISGAGAVKLRGRADEQKISMSGAGGYDAQKLKSRTCNISISGVGGAKVYVTEDLNASVSGVGGVSYSGNPVNVRSDVSGLGSISAENEDPS